MTAVKQSGSDSRVLQIAHFLDAQLAQHTPAAVTRQWSRLFLFFTLPNSCRSGAFGFFALARWRSCLVQKARVCFRGNRVQQGCGRCGVAAAGARWQ
jgi:hypothetical protein